LSGGYAEEMCDRSAVRTLRTPGVKRQQQRSAASLTGELRRTALTDVASAANSTHVVAVR